MGTPKHFPCPYCGDDGSEVDELEWEVEELTEKLAKANERIDELEKYNLDLANESHNKSLAIDRANEREMRLEKILQRYESEQLQPLKLRVKDLEQTLEQILGWRELRETPNFPVERVEDLCREQLRKEQE